MKKIAGLVIILAVLILGGYYGMGFFTERTIKKNIEVINQSHGLYADIQEYDRGWFSSNAKIKWRMEVPERIIKDANGNSQTIAAQTYQMDMPITIYHGPIIYADNGLHFGMGYAKTIFPFPAQYYENFDSMFTKESVKPQIDLGIFVSYLNRSTIELVLPTFKLIFKDKTGQLDWMGMKSTTTMTKNLDKLEGSIVIEGLQISKDDTKVNLGKVTTEYDLHQTPAGLYLGDASFTLPSLEISNKDQKIYGVNNLVLSSNSDIENSLFSTHFNVSVDSVLSNSVSYGPGQLEMSLRNLDADVLATINQQATAMQNGTQAERQQAMIAMLPELPKLFSKGAEFEISKCSMKLPQGTVEGDLLLSLPKGDNANPFEAIQKLQGNAKLRVPAAVVKQLMQQSVIQQMTKQPELQQALVQQLSNGQQPQATATQPQATTPQTAQPQAAQPTPSQEQLASMQADKQINTLMQNGVIVADGTDYVIEMTLQQGKLMVNGKPFDPAMMKF